MPPRTTIKSRDRPLSAIYIGSTPSTPASNVSSIPQTIPDLPEPPSPIGSGLPSPPATNSTESGSTGDPTSMARRRMVETIQNSQDSSEGNSSSRSSSRLSATHDGHEFDQDEEEQTMRLKIGADSNESVLERARSLAQRNKLQLDKLAAGKSGRASPSSSSRTHRHSMPDPSRALSGSETEREGDSITYNSTSTSDSREKRLSSAPASPYRNRNQRVGSSHSSTTSPARRRKRVSYNNDYNSASDDNYDERLPTANIKKTPLIGTRRRSALPREFRDGSADEESTTKDKAPYTKSAATVATSPMLSTGRRLILHASDDYPRDPLSRAYTTPVPAPNSATPISTKRTLDHDNSSPTIHVSGSATIGRHTAARRERGQVLRGGSAESALGGPTSRSLVGEGLRAAGLNRGVGVGARRDRERSLNTTISDLDSNKLRPMRTSNSPDVFTRSGWDPEDSSVRRSRRSVFDAPESASSPRTLPPRASTSMADYNSQSRTSMSTIYQQSDSEDDRGDEDGGVNRANGEVDGRIVRTRKGALTSREASLSRREQQLLEKERELNRREREMDRAGSVLGRYHNNSTSTTATPSPSPSPASSRDRYSGSFGTGSRQTSGHNNQPSQASSQSHKSNIQSEHAKLMVNSLSMFESQIVKLIPALGTAGTNHAEMLTRNAQILVVTAERLNTMLRVGNGRAIDAQIEAEVEGDYVPPYNSVFGSRDPSLTPLDIWKKVGIDYRDGLRVSDELIRAATGLLLGVGRVMKEYLQQSSDIRSTYGGTPRGSPAVHGKRISLGEEDARLGGVSPEIRESRRSWEVGTVSSASGGGGAVRRSGSSNASVSTGTGSGGSGSVVVGTREEALRRLAGIRPDSPLARASPAFHAVRELDRLENTSPALGTASATGGATLGLPKVNFPGTRKLFSPSQQREMALVNHHHQQSNLGDLYDPSPTPASRISRSFDRILDTGGRGELGMPAALTQQEYQHTPLQSAHEVTPLERSRTLTSSRGGQMYETPLRRNLTLANGERVDGQATPSDVARGRDERRISIASATSATTIRGANDTGSSSVPNAIHNLGPSIRSTPSGATTILTLDESISDFTSPRLMEMSMETQNARTENMVTGTSQRGGAMFLTSMRPTFSRPDGGSELQKQLQGYRHTTVVPGATVEMDVSMSGDRSANESANGKGRISLSAHERERGTTRKLMGVVIGSSTSMPLRNGVRVPIGSSHGITSDEAGEFGEMESRGVSSATTSTGVTGNGDGRRLIDSSASATSRNTAATVGGVMRKERRTVADIWPKSRG